MDLATATAINELTEQIKVVVEQVQKMTLKSAEHDQTLAFLQHKPTETVEMKSPAEAQLLTFDAFRIPDPIKSLPEYDGNKKQLSAWLQTAEDTLNVFAPLVCEPQFKLYLQAVSNKIKGRAKDALCLAGNPQNFQEIKMILLETLGDKQELSFYKSQLWATKQIEGMTVHSYFSKIKENVQNIKTLAKQNAIYNHAWPAINTFIDEDALAAFISGLRKPYFGYAQAARPKSIEEAYAFLCKFSSNETISENSRRTNNQTPIRNLQPNQRQKDRNQTNYYNNQTQNRPNPPKDGDVSMKSINLNGRKITPMEVDTSIRSRNTFNRKIINTHELYKEDKDHEVQNVNPEDPFL